MFKGLLNCIEIVTDYGQKKKKKKKLKPLPQLNKLNKRFNKINENVGVNRAPIRIRPLGRAKVSGSDNFEKRKINKMKNKRINRASPGFRFGSANRVGPGLEVATL